MWRERFARATKDEMPKLNEDEAWTVMAMDLVLQTETDKTQTKYLSVFVWFVR